MSVYRHDYDFVVSGTRTQQKEFEEPTISSSSILPHWERAEVRILNRIVRWVNSFIQRVEHEADPRHAELIIHQLGLS